MHFLEYLKYLVIVLQVHPKTALRARIRCRLLSQFCSLLHSVSGYIETHVPVGAVPYGINCWVPRRGTKICQSRPFHALRVRHGAYIYSICFCCFSYTTSSNRQATAGDNHPVFKTLTSVWRFKPVIAPIPTPSSSFPPMGQLIPTPASISHSVGGSTLKSSLAATCLSLDIVFVFANPMHAALSSAVIGQVSDKMIEAFVNRCSEVYGSGLGQT